MKINIKNKHFIWNEFFYFKLLPLIVIDIRIQFIDLWKIVLMYMKFKRAIICLEYIFLILYEINWYKINNSF